MKHYLLTAFILYSVIASAQMPTPTPTKEQLQNPAIMAMNPIKINPADTAFLQMDFSDLPYGRMPYFMMTHNAKIYTKEERDSLMNYLRSFK